MNMHRYKNDPIPIVAKFSTHCKFCGAYVNKNDRAFYWPATKTLKCSDCGESDYKEFLSAKADEEEFHGVGNPY